MDVVVIGAGLSGLTAASTLCEAGANVQVLEADSQIGGRIRAIRDPGNARAVADLGPTWIWPKYQPVVARWMPKQSVSCSRIALRSRSGSAFRRSADHPTKPKSAAGVCAAPV